MILSAAVIVLSAFAYNFPQGRMSDHRINLTLYRLDEIMNGDLTELLNALATEHQADQLAAMAETL